MISELQTTLFIIFWYAIYLVASCLLSFYFLMSRPAASAASNKPWQFNLYFLQQTLKLPALLWLPLVISLGFLWFRINLIFPIGFDTSLTEVWLRTTVPAAILFLSTGTMQKSISKVSEELRTWSATRFFTFARSVGFSRTKTLRRLILSRAILSSASYGLPWFFTELIVVECLLNVPGLGSLAWQAARLRNFNDLEIILALLMVIFGALSGGNAWLDYKLGKKLESYA